MFPLLLLIASSGTQAQEEFKWNRWEQRTVDCISSGEKDVCILKAPNAVLPKDPKEYKCRREPMPQHKWNQLARNSTTRLACPIGCEPDFDLSVITKVPFDNSKCQKYYTYGKYREVTENEWYLWMTEPCVAALTTHCRFKDVPLNAKNTESRKLKQKALLRKI
ncbi:hypothetical protein NECAME_09271 [Necator americanus]|uniref:DUF7808 domain-containing protein n=1 Tax=Necator americanus TaxID=51031 RepID=W2TEU7_NECAM|nr:hypothetical protein NECAME_09271 [Necator americanus]ETN80333.1 hypothetical protein NECAME_09271 [Necator americanus]